MSASWSNSSGVARSPSAMPILAEILSGVELAAMIKGVARTSRSRSATTSTPASSESPNGVSLSDGTQKSHANANEELVTGAVTERVVDVLEVVEIQEECGNVVMFTSRSRQHSVDSVQDQRSIGKSRERIV